MAIARQKSEWNHTAPLLAIIHNMMAESPISADEFHPFASIATQRKNTEAPRISSLKGLF